jgi:hypothetical protein
MVMTEQLASGYRRPNCRHPSTLNEMRLRQSHRGHRDVIAEVADTQTCARANTMNRCDKAELRSIF